MELTGLQNPLVKAASELKQKKCRQQQGLFLAEGLRTVEEAVASKSVESIFILLLRTSESGLCWSRRQQRMCALFAWLIML